MATSRAASTTLVSWLVMPALPATANPPASSVMKTITRAVRSSVAPAWAAAANVVVASAPPSVFGKVGQRDYYAIMIFVRVITAGLRNAFEHNTVSIG